MQIVAELLKGLDNHLKGLSLDDRYKAVCEMLETLEAEKPLYNADVFKLVATGVEYRKMQIRQELQEQHKATVAKLDKEIAVGDLSPSDYIRKRADSLKGIVRASKPVGDAIPPATEKTAKNATEAFLSGFTKSIATVDHRIKRK